ncbi:MAG: sugar ABC transporter substrate-binding protein [Eubacteriales bacterium]|nr:sugar ABC transporter substrate-binding protein [Eubacteriales bacterium]
MKKFLSILLVLMLLIPAAAMADDVKTLDMLWFSDGAETDAMLKLIAEYEGLNPGIKINLLEVPFEDMSQKIMMSVAGGEPPALVRTTEGITSNVNEAYVDIGDYVEDKDALLAQFMSSIQSYFVLNGKICALPTDVTANGMIYNKTAFDKAGVAVPTSPDDIWTWDEFVAGVKTVMEKGGVQYGLVIDNPSHRWSTILYEFGGRFVTPEGPAFNSPEAIAAINLTKSLFDEGIVPKSTWLGGEDPNNLFRSGQVAVHLSGNWMLTNYRDNIKDFEWGVTYCPIEKNRSSVPGGKQLAACAGTGVEQEAVDFIVWVTGQEANKQYCEESLFISPRLDNAELNYSFGSEYFAIFANELANTVEAAAGDWGFPGLAAKIGTTLTEGMYEVVAGSLTAEELVEEVDALAAELF